MTTQRCILRGQPEPRRVLINMSAERIYPDSQRFAAVGNRSIVRFHHISPGKYCERTVMFSVVTISDRLYSTRKIDQKCTSRGTTCLCAPANVSAARAQDAAARAKGAAAREEDSRARAPVPPASARESPASAAETHARATRVAARAQRASAAAPMRVGWRGFRL